MAERVAEIFVGALTLYVAPGFLFAIAFVSFEARMVDPPNAICPPVLTLYGRLETNCFAVPCYALEGACMPDDVYLINKAKTEFREGYNDGNVEQVLSVFDTSLVDMSQGELTGFGEGGLDRMLQRLAALFAEYHVKMAPIVIDVIVNGSSAYDFGWHEITLTPKAGGQRLHQRLRYLEHWKKNAAGEWKITFFVSNEDRKEVFNGLQPRWFISEDKVAAN